MRSDTRPMLMTLALSLALATPLTALAQDAPEAPQPDTTQPDSATPAPAPRTTSEVFILVSPADAIVEMNGAPIDIKDSLQLSPGAYEFKITREGYKSRIDTLRIANNAPDVIMSISLSKTDPEAIQIGRTGGLVDNLDQARKPIGWASLAVGVGLAGTGIFLAARSGVPDDCSQLTPQSCKDAKDFAAASLFTGTLGGVLVASGMGLLIWDSLAGEDAQGAESARKTLRLVPTAGARGAGFELNF